MKLSLGQVVEQLREAGCPCDDPVSLRLVGRVYVVNVEHADESCPIGQWLASIDAARWN